MDYTGNICPGCDIAFTDCDDIVVCPECGTPQHRECYEKENKCVNSDKHAEGYVWQGVTFKKPTVTHTPARETVPCPNCGNENPKGAEVCSTCGMKFTIFGMNVVDAMHEKENENKNHNNNIPDYKAPFTLGEGEGFDGINQQTANDTAEAIKNIFSGEFSENGQGSVSGDGRINLGGPFPLDDEIGGVRTNTIGNFIGSNALSYISKFRKIQAGSKLSFNFAAFFLSPYWYFFRKLYKAGILFMTISVALSILSVPSSIAFMEYMQTLASTLPEAAENLTDAHLMEITNGMLEAMKPSFIFAFANILLHLISGFSANHIYKKYVTENAGKAERMADKKSAIAHIVKYGGASILIAAGAYFAQEILMMFISYLL